MSKRYFEFVEGTSNKFWEVWLEGTQVLTRYGKIGANGATTTKDEGSAEKAQKLFDKLVKEKTGKGYLEKAAAVEAEAPALDPQALEAHLAKVQASTTADALLVFADWLQSAGHPWGRLIAVQHALATATGAAKAELEKEEKTILRVSGAELTGNLQRTKNTDFEWTSGFMRTAIVGAPGDGALLAKNLEVLLALPTARLLTTLVLDPRPEELHTVRDWDASEDNIVAPWPQVVPLLAKLPARITHVSLGALEPAPASAYVTMPAFAQLTQSLQQLEHLSLTGSTQAPDPLDLPNLKRLDVHFAAANGQALNALATSKLPKLEHLSVSIGGISNCVLDDAIPANEWDADDEDALRYPLTFPASTLEELEVYDVDAEVRALDLADFLRAKWPTSLKSLGLTNATLDDATVQLIADSAILPQLTSLDLSNGTLKDAAAATLLKEKTRFAHLTSLNLEGNLLSEPIATSLTKALPNVKTGKQRTENTPEFFMRYVATME
jgi:uncharacterized protein (TIGR02996 family)